MSQQQNCINFDGIDDIVHIPDNNSLDLTTSGTIETWINVDVFKVAAGVVHKGDNTLYTDEQYSLQFYWLTGSYAKICFVIGHSDGTEGVTWNKLVSNTTLTTGSWYHVVAEWNSSTMNIYINGNLDATRANTIMPTNYSGGLNIGSQCYSEPPKRPFDGKIDEIRIWNTCRTQTQIRENMYKHLNGNESGLVAYYDFETGSGTTLQSLTSGPIQSITINSAGSGYTSFPTISFSGGGGSGVTASVSSLKVVSNTVSAGGTNYRVGNTLTVTGGTRTTAALLNVTAVSGGSRGPVVSASVNTAGVYTVLPSNPVSITGGNGSGAQFNLSWGVNAVSLTNGGSGYTSAPTITFNPSGATATAVVANNSGTLYNGATWEVANAPVAHGWNGGTSTDWSNTANWFGNWLPYNVIPVNVANSASANCVIGADVECEGLTIESSRSLTINPGYTLKAYGNTLIDGTFIIETTTTNTGNFIDNGTINYGSSALVNVKKTLTKDKWHYNSSPVNSSSSNVFWGSAVYFYVEADGQYGTTVAWKPVVAGTILSNMTGYDIYVKSSDKTITYSGELNTGNYSNSSLTRSWDGFNYIGNPYPSAIDWDASSGWTKTNLDDAIYIWDPNLNSGAGNFMSYVNGTPANGGSRYIPATQAFWVKVSAGQTSGTIGMSNSIRVSNSTQYRSSATPGDVLRIKCETTGFSDEAVISFKKNATEEYDAHFDANKFFVQTGAGSMIYTSAGDELLSINSLPSLSGQLSVPLFSRVLIGNEMTIEATDLNDFDLTYDIFLEDLKLNKIVNLRQGKYAYISEIADPENRFMIHFIPVNNVANSEIKDTKTSIEQENTNEKVRIFSDGANIFITSEMETAKEQTVFIYDLNGKLIYHSSLKLSFNKISLENNSGIFLVKVISNQEVFTNKVMLK